MTTRRQFLEESLLATAAVTTGLASSTRGADRDSAGPVDELTAAIIGCGTRGGQHVQALSGLPGCRITHVCDPDQQRVERLVGQVQESTGHRPQGVRDLRRILDDKSVDVVFVATCNHWHALAAIWAMQAGKDVYLEKPVSHTVEEGRRIVQCAEQTGQLCQTGTQRRSEGAFRAAMEYIHAGKLGEVKLAKSIIYRRRKSIGGPGEYAVPSSVDYNLWAGPAPLSPITRPQFHYDWHWFWETGNGELGNNNIHMVDLCRWGLGVEGLGRSVLSFGGRFGYQDAAQTPNTQVVVHDFGEKAIIQETRGLETKHYSDMAQDGAIFFGTEGIIAGSTLFTRDGKKVRDFEGNGESHFANFLRAVRQRDRQLLHADIVEGHASTGLCQVGNISYRVGAPTDVAEIKTRLEQLTHSEVAVETLERTVHHLEENGIDLQTTPLRLGEHLKIDAKTERFSNSDKANSLLSHPYRRPFVLPEIA